MSRYNLYINAILLRAWTAPLIILPWACDCPLHTIALKSYINILRFDKISSCQVFVLEVGFLEMPSSLTNT